MNNNSQNFDEVIKLEPNRQNKAIQQLKNLGINKIKKHTQSNKAYKDLEAIINNKHYFIDIKTSNVTNFYFENYDQIKPVINKNAGKVHNQYKDLLYNLIKDGEHTFKHVYLKDDIKDNYLIYKRTKDGSKTCLFNLYELKQYVIKNENNFQLHINYSHNSYQSDGWNTLALVIPENIYKMFEIKIQG